MDRPQDNPWIFVLFFGLMFTFGVLLTVLLLLG